jgi:hypothetical protein
MANWTVIDEQRTVDVEMTDDLVLDPGVLRWERKPEGLCRGEVCVPVRSDGPLDLPEIARLLNRPVAIDAQHRVAAIAASAGDRADTLRSGIAPDFELPDVDGVMHRLSDHRGRKVVLYAYGSW